MQKVVKKVASILMIAAIGISMTSCSSAKDMQLIEDFLNCWLEKSEENEELTQEAFQDMYGKYMTEEALDEFMAELYPISREMFTSQDEWKVSEISIEKDSEEYMFLAQVAVEGEAEWRAVVVEGTIRMEDGKIDKIENPMVNKNDMEETYIFDEQVCSEFSSVIWHDSNTEKTRIQDEETLAKLANEFSKMRGIKIDRCPDMEGFIFMDVYSSKSKSNERYDVDINSEIIIVNGNIYTTSEDYTQGIYSALGL